MTPQEEITQMHFDFNDWELAFKTWHENLPIYGDEMQFVISEHFYTSGYWIEAKGKNITKTDNVYLGDEVLELEKRVRAGIAKEKTTGRNGLIL